MSKKFSTLNRSYLLVLGLLLLSVSFSGCFEPEEDAVAVEFIEFDSVSTQASDYSNSIDIGGTGYSNAVMEDTDNDGVIDFMAYDVHDDGILDGFFYDTTGDGYLDRMDLDLDGDGVMEVSQFDVDADGIPDVWDYGADGSIEGYDTDLDGFADSWDFDHDGIFEDFDSDFDGLPDLRQGAAGFQNEIDGVYEPFPWESQESSSDQILGGVSDSVPEENFPDIGSDFIPEEGSGDSLCTTQKDSYDACVEFYTKTWPGGYGDFKNPTIAAHCTGCNQMYTNESDIEQCYADAKAGFVLICSAVHTPLQ